MIATVRTVTVGVLIIGSAAAGCARPQAPRGGAVPETPLRVIETVPANLSVVDGFEGSVLLRFDRTVSDRLTQGAAIDAVIVSPAAGELEVEASGETIEISMEGGFPAGAIYQITLLARFRDRYQNEMAGPFNLFFSTGPALEPNLIAGLVSDRLTFEPVEEARLDAALGDGGVVRTVVTDSTGVFSVPYLSEGVYSLVAYDDTNRDGEPGFGEDQDSVSVTVALGDTLIITDIELLARDTTSAVLDEVQALDSIAVAATLDDFLDPDESLVPIEATVSAEDGDAIEVVEVLHRWQWDERRAEATAAAASVVDLDTVSADPTPAPVAPAPADGDTGPVLPARELVLVLGSSVLPEVPYQVELSGVRNIRGLPGGGGTAELVWSPPQPPPPAEADDPDDPDGADAAADSTGAAGI